MTPSTEVSSNLISSERVEGTKVFATNGDKLGSIDDLMIDKISGQVRFAVLEFGGVLGIGTDRYPVPWSMLDYDPAREGYVVPLDKDTIQNAPRYGKDELRDYDPEYSRDINSYYGVGPL